MRKVIHLSVLFVMLWTNTVKTETGVPQPKRFDCDVVLNSCIAFAKALEEERDGLRAMLREADARESKLREEARAYPWYYWAILGLSTGYALGLTVKGEK